MFHLHCTMVEPAPSAGWFTPSDLCILPVAGYMRLAASGHSAGAGGAVLAPCSAAAGVDEGELCEGVGDVSGFIEPVAVALVG